MNILKSAFFGLLLVVAACVLLFWAEGRAVKTARALEEGAGLVVEVDAAAIDAANDGKLVHISGAVTPQDVPGDPRLGIKAEGAVRLVRQVEMYQWRELAKEVERTASDGSKTKSTVYDYEKVWSSTPIDSAGFKMASAPKNPPMPLKGEAFDVGEVKVGAFRIGGRDVSGLGSEAPLPLSDDGAGRVATAMGGGMPVWLADNRFVLGSDPEKPQIGDVRIGYARSDLALLSAAGAQKGDRLVPYVTSNGREVFLVQSGKATAADMFKDAISGNAVMTWVIRGVGLILMFIGFTLTFRLLTGLADAVPVIGGLVRAGTSLIALVLTLALGSVVIAMGWVFYRPLLALAIAAIGVLAAVALGVIGGKKGAVEPVKA